MSQTTDPLPASPYLEVGEAQILIKCRFSEPVQHLLRSIPDLQWRPDLGGWTLPVSAIETLRPLVPEALRLIEASEAPGAPHAAAMEPDPEKSREDLFKAAARLLFGSDWQRQAARALGRDETALARFLLGERTHEDADLLYADMLALMLQRAADIVSAADRFAQVLAPQPDGERKPPADQGM
ncbi:MAG TPA: hypothetical protein VIJ06_01820 [Methylovirgula sp.]